MVQGTAYAQVYCTGSSQSGSVTVTTYNQPFSKGSALVTASLTSWQTFEETVDQKEVRVK